MFGIGMPELIIIMVILLLVVGPGKLPQLGASLGGALRGFRNAADGVDEEHADSGKIQDSGK